MKERPLWKTAVYAWLIFMGLGILYNLIQMML